MSWSATTCCRSAVLVMEPLGMQVSTGTSLNELAARFGIHRITVTHHRHRNGVAVRGRGLDSQQVDHAVRSTSAATARRYVLSTNHGPGPRPGSARAAPHPLPATGGVGTPPSRR
jgi:hypothetical protein